MDDMKIRSGARLNFTIERSNSEAVSATFIADDGDGHIISDTVAYDSEGIATFQFDSPDTDIEPDVEEVEFEYQINENFESGSPDIYPNADCDGDCEFPLLIICESKSEGS